MDRPPPAYSEDADDPFQGGIPNDPNLSSTAPPHPSSMVLPNPNLANRTWYVLSNTPVVGMTYDWHLTNNIITGIANPGHVSYNSWSEALSAYTHAYSTDSIVINTVPSRRSRRRAGTPFNASQTPAGAGPSSPYLNAPVTPTPNAPATPQHPLTLQTPAGTPGADHASSYAASADVQPPPHIRNLTAPGSAAPTPTKSAPSKTGASTRLRLIREALGEKSPTTPPSAPDVHIVDGIRARIKALEEELNSYLARHEPVPSPPTPTPANSNVEGRLTALEEAMNLILHREAVLESRQAVQSGTQDPALSQPLQACGPTSLHSIPPASPAAGSSTGPGTIAGASSQQSPHPRRPTVIVIEDDSDEEEEYAFDDLTPAEESELAQLLQAIHENYLANSR